MNATRHFSPLDRLLGDMQNALETVLGAPRAGRANPAAGEVEVVLDEEERRHAAGLMRVNHVGEVCAQALYVGQASVAQDPATRADLLAAAAEETDHLAWCAERLHELDSRPSLLNPVWYAGSYAIGALAGLRGDGWNLAPRQSMRSRSSARTARRCASARATNASPCTCPAPSATWCAASPPPGTC